MPNFRPDTGRRRWSLFRLLVPSPCREELALLSLSMLLRLPAALYGACSALHAVPALLCSTKARTWLRLHFVHSLAQAAQAARSLTGALPGCGMPSPLCVPSPSPCLRQSGACALCLAATLPVDVHHPESQEVFG